MRRLLRLVTLWLFALALPLQGASATAAMIAHEHAPSQRMTMPDGTTMDAAAMPCHGHAVDKAGCGACCAPIAAEQGVLAVAPVAPLWAARPGVAATVAAPQFLTGGTERPPRPVLA